MTGIRLLICTQAVDQNDPTLGFFHRWIEEFARHCAHVYVICLFAGAHTLPRNVTVLSLGKEYKHSRVQYLRRFFWYIWKYRRDYDAVFIHMNQIYALLGGTLWRLWRKRICLWYAHGAAPFSLRTAEMLADAIVTSTPEGFRLKSGKIHVVGQGIDTALFAQCAREARTDRIRILYVGRIAPVKRCEILIEATALLCARGADVFVTLVGDMTAPDTRSYYESLQALIRARGLEDSVTFVGGVPHEEVRAYLCLADICVNPSMTGSLDKAGVEALAAGVPIITCNEAFKNVLRPHADRLMFPAGDAQTLADRIIALHRAPDRQAIASALSAKVRQDHSLETLVPRILSVVGAISA